MKLGVLFLLMFLAITPVMAQELERSSRMRMEPEMVQSVLDTPQVLHVTDQINNTSEARAALADFQERKRLGLLGASGKQAAVLNDTLVFKVYNFQKSTSTVIQDNIRFVLKRTATRLNLWVEVDEIKNGRVTESHLDALFASLSSQTPSNSINPQAGIIVNDEAVFGNPPNVDGDNKTDVLLVDVRDGAGAGASYIAGFVFSGDLSSFGNNRDVLYLDTNPGLSRGINGVALTAAHEYQHLIHYNYNVDEIRFVNEGLSEWAEVMNGYQGRTMTYLQDKNKYNVSLLRFVDASNSLVLDDYQRAGLWTSYIAERIGTATGQITRNTATGTQGYTNVLTTLNLTLADVLHDFHIANVLNNTRLNAKYGYAHPLLASMPPAIPQAIYDGRLIASTPSTSLSVNEGAAQYAQWNYVKDFTLTLNVSTAHASRMRGTALVFRGSNFEAVPINLTQPTAFFAGAIDKLIVAFVHINPNSINTNVTYSASWDPGQTYQTSTVTYDTGKVSLNGNALDAFQLCGRDATTLAPNSENCGNSRQANRFVRPDKGILSSVAVALYYDNEFPSQTGVPSNAPRNFRLVIWNDDNGRPGTQELFSLDVTDGRQNLSGGQLVFHQVDLEAYRSQLSALPNAFHIGVTDSGTDQNYVLMAVTPYTGDNVSFLYLKSFNNGQGIWAALPELMSGGEPILKDRVIPIRATFLIPTATEEEGEVPSQITLHPNFPNPFNPSTTIQYSLPQVTPVRLAVYDLLGREVAVLVDGMQTPGQHDVRVDASRWASGVYFYTLQTAETRITRRMMLIK